MAEDAASRTEEPTPKRREEARTDGRIPAVRGDHLGDGAAGGVVGDLAERRRRGQRSARVDAPEPAGHLQGRSHAGRSSATCCSGMLHDVSGVVIPILRRPRSRASWRRWPRSAVQFHGKRLLPDSQQDLAGERPAAHLLEQGALRPDEGDRQDRARRVDLLEADWCGRGQHHRALGRVAARMLAIAGREVARLVGWVTGVLIVLAAVDYGWQRRQHQQSLRMTRTEVKDEARQSEGIPRSSRDCGGRTRSWSRPAASPTFRRPTSSSPTPSTSRWRSGTCPGRWGPRRSSPRAPRAWPSASRRSPAQHGVPIMERRSLARAIFRSVPVGGEIPATLYRAVAEILAYIYGLRQQRAGREALGAMAATKPRKGVMGRVLAGGELVIPLTFVVVVIVMIIPLPTVVLDLLLTRQHRGVADHPAGGDVHAEAARVLDLPVGAAGHDAVPAVAERRLDAADPAARARGLRRRRVTSSRRSAASWSAATTSSAWSSS